MSDTVDDVEKKSGELNNKSSVGAKILLFLSGVALIALILFLFTGRIALVTLVVLGIILSIVWGCLVFIWNIPLRFNHAASSLCNRISVIAAIIVDVIVVFLSGFSLVGYSAGISTRTITSIFSKLPLSDILGSLWDNHVLLIWLGVIVLGIFSFLLVCCLIRLISLSIVFNFTTGRKAYVKRCLLLIAPIALLLFLYVIYSPFEIFFANLSDMGYLVFGDIWWIFLLIFIVVLLGLTAIFSLFTGKIFEWIVCIIFGIGLASYIQMMFLNAEIGILDGNISSALTNPIWLIFNILIWVAIISIPFIIRHFLKKYWELVIRYGSIILSVILIIAVISMIITAPVNAFERSADGYYLSSTNQYTLSSDNNIVLFIVDYDSNNYLDELLEIDSHALDAFSDFTYYNNADCVYMGTYPSVLHMLTGNEINTNITVSKWFEESWNADSTKMFYNHLRENGYSTYLYADAKAIGNADNFLDIASNIEPVDVNNITVNYLGIPREFVITSMFKCFPNIIKSIVASMSVNYNDLASCEIVGGTNNAKYYSKLCSEGIRLINSENVFTVQHIYGTHGPCKTDEYCSQVPFATYLQAQKGCLALLEEYLSQMEELGVYDSATIIITSDHGAFMIDTQPIFLIKEPYASHSQIIVNTAPITHCELFSTILSNIGVDYSMYGPSIYDIKEDEVRYRTHYVREHDTSYPEIPKYNTMSRATANVYYVYTYAGDRDALQKEIDDEHYQVLPMIEGYF